MEKRKAISWLSDTINQSRKLNIPKLIQKKIIELRNEKSHKEIMRQGAEAVKKEYKHLSKFFENNFYLPEYGLDANIEIYQIIMVNDKIAKTKEEFFELLEEGLFPLKIDVLIDDKKRRPFIRRYPLNNFLEAKIQPKAKSVREPNKDNMSLWEKVAPYLNQEIQLKGYELDTSIFCYGIDDSKENVAISKRDYLEKLRNGFVPNRVLFMVTDKKNNISYPDSLKLSDFLERVVNVKKEINIVHPKEPEKRVIQEINEIPQIADNIMTPEKLNPKDKEEKIDIKGLEKPVIASIHTGNEIHLGFEEKPSENINEKQQEPIQTQEEIQQENQKELEEYKKLKEYLETDFFVKGETGAFRITEIQMTRGTLITTKEEYLKALKQEKPEWISIENKEQEFYTKMSPEEFYPQLSTITLSETKKIKEQEEPKIEEVPQIQQRHVKEEIIQQQYNNEYYKNVADLFGKRLDLSSFGYPSGYVRCIGFIVDEEEYVFNSKKAIQYLEKGYVPQIIHFDCYNQTQNGMTQFTLDGNLFDKVITLPIAKITSNEQKKCDKLKEYIGAEFQLKSGMDSYKISCIEMERGNYFVINNGKEIWENSSTDISEIKNGYQEAIENGNQAKNIWIEKIDSKEDPTVIYLSLEEFLSSIKSLPMTQEKQQPLPIASLEYKTTSQQEKHEGLWEKMGTPTEIEEAKRRR